MSDTMKISTGACRYADPFSSECRASSNILTMPKSTGKASATPLRFFIDSAIQPLHGVIDGRESVRLRSHHDGFVPGQVLSTSAEVASFNPDYSSAAER